MPDIIDPRTPIARAARPCIPSVPRLCLPLLLSLRRFVASLLEGSFGIKPGSFRGRFGVISGSFGGRFGVVLGSVWGRFLQPAKTRTPGPASTSAADTPEKSLSATCASHVCLTGWGRLPCPNALVPPIPPRPFGNPPRTASPRLLLPLHSSPQETLL